MEQLVRIQLSIKQVKNAKQTSKVFMQYNRLLPLDTMFRPTVTVFMLGMLVGKVKSVCDSELRKYLL